MQSLLKYLDFIVAEKEVQDSTSPQQIDSSNPQVEEAIPVEDEGKYMIHQCLPNGHTRNIHKSDSVPQNPNLPPVSAKNRKDASVPLPLFPF